MLSRSQRRGQAGAALHSCTPPWHAHCYRLLKRHPPPRFAGALRRSPRASLGKNSTRSGYDVRAHGRHTQRGPSVKQPSIAMTSSRRPSGNSVEHSWHGWQPEEVGGGTTASSSLSSAPLDELDGGRSLVPRFAASCPSLLASLSSPTSCRARRKRARRRSLSAKSTANMRLRMHRCRWRCRRALRAALRRRFALSAFADASPAGRSREATAVVASSAASAG